MLFLLGLLSTSQSALSPARRGRGRSNFIQRGGRELAGYGGGDGGGGGEGCGGEREEEGDGAGIDFSGCTEEPETGLCCIEKEECVTSLEKDPVLECTHKNVEQCHYTYVTQFTPSQEEVCEENFEKICSITFTQQAYNETVEKCYTPVEKVCGGEGPEECRTVLESSCTTRYREKAPGKFVADTRCEKLPTELCGAGCSYQEGPEECHDKVLTSLVDVPQEVCDLNPQKTCRFTTKLVPKLKPEHECTIVPKETCVLKFSTPREVRKPLLTKWCLDPQDPPPGESYEEENAFAPVLSSGSAPQSYGVPPPASPDYSAPAPESYGAPPSARQPATGYAAPASAPAGEGYAAPSRSYDGPAQSSGPPVYREQSESQDSDDSYDYSYDEIGPLGDIYAAPAAPAQDYNVPAVNAREFSAPTSQPVRDYSAPSPSAGALNSYSSPQLRSFGANSFRTGRRGRTGRRQKMMQKRFPRG